MRQNRPQFYIPSHSTLRSGIRPHDLCKYYRVPLNLITVWLASIPSVVAQPWPPQLVFKPRLTPRSAPNPSLRPVAPPPAPSPPPPTPNLPMLPPSTTSRGQLRGPMPPLRLASTRSASRTPPPSTRTSRMTSSSSTRRRTTRESSLPPSTERPSPSTPASSPAGPPRTSGSSATSDQTLTRTCGGAMSTRPSLPRSTRICTRLPSTT